MEGEEGARERHPAVCRLAREPIKEEDDPNLELCAAQRLVPLQRELRALKVRGACVGALASRRGAGAHLRRGNQRQSEAISGSQWQSVVITWVRSCAEEEGTGGVGRAAAAVQMARRLRERRSAAVTAYEALGEGGVDGVDALSQPRARREPRVEGGLALGLLLHRDEDVVPATPAHGTAHVTALVMAGGGARVASVPDAAGRTHQPSSRRSQVQSGAIRSNQEQPGATRSDQE